MSQIHHKYELERHIVEQLTIAGWLVGKLSTGAAARVCWND